MANVQILTALIALFFVTTQCYLVGSHHVNSSIYLKNGTNRANLTAWNSSQIVDSYSSRHLRNGTNYTAWNNTRFANYSYNLTNNGTKQKPSNLNFWNNGTKWNHSNNARTHQRNYNYYQDYTYYNGTTSNGNIILGVITNYDRLLFVKEFSKEGRWWWGRDEIVEYPSEMPSGHVRQETIHAIRIYNLRYHAARKSQAKIVKGGIGSQFIRIELSSVRGEGYSFLVQIYGH